MSAPFSPPKVFLQETESSCAVACLRMAASAFGVETNEEELRSLCHTTDRGTVIDDLLAGALSLGLEARIASLKLDDINPTQELVIAYLDLLPLDNIETTHAILIVRAEEQVICLDPRLGERMIARQSFEQAWMGTRGLSLVISGRAEP